MKKLALIFLVIAGSINIALGLSGSPWNYLAAVLFAFAAISIYKSAE
jgi:hypothetical protein